MPAEFPSVKILSLQMSFLSFNINFLVEIDGISLIEENRLPSM